MFKPIDVRTQSSDEYKIHFGEDIFTDILSQELHSLSARKAVMMVDSNVFKLHEALISKFIQNSELIISLYIVPEGESSKSFEQFKAALDSVLKSGIDRKTVMVAIGGGVTGDLGGYVAASALRGIPLIHIPTTLLAMVDSSIGGKTGINHESGKNLIGAFYQPKAIITDVQFLSTLDQRDWINGLSEILKYGVIRDKSILDDCARVIKENGFKISDDWISIIQRSAQIKVDVVEEDVYESGVREHLNFGHTFAHAIENFTGYGSISHGEAVFAGMLAALNAGKENGYSADPSAIYDFKDLYNINLKELKGNIDTLLELMKRDKKANNDTIRLVLAKELESILVEPIEDHSMIRNAWDYIIDEFEE